MKHLKKLFSKLKVGFEISDPVLVDYRQKVLPPDVTPPLPTIEQLIEGYINAINTQKAAYDTSGIRLLCQNKTISATDLAKLQALSTALVAFKNDVNSCISLANA